MEYYKRETENLLRQLGVNGSYIGFDYILYGVDITIKNPNLTTYICKGLYVEIALYFHTTVKCAERNIRTIINAIWNCGNRKLLNKIFSVELTEKPKNAAFIDTLARYVENNYTVPESDIEDRLAELNQLIAKSCKTFKEIKEFLSQK